MYNLPHNDIKDSLLFSSETYGFAGRDDCKALVPGQSAPRLHNNNTSLVVDGAEIVMVLGLPG